MRLRRSSRLEPNRNRHCWRAAALESRSGSRFKRLAAVHAHAADLAAVGRPAHQQVRQRQARGRLQRPRLRPVSCDLHRTLTLDRSAAPSRPREGRGPAHPSWLVCLCGLATRSSGSRALAASDGVTAGQASLLAAYGWPRRGRQRKVMRSLTAVRLRAALGRVQATDERCWSGRVV
jgi:hypothetical protein